MASMVYHLQTHHGRLIRSGPLPQPLILLETREYRSAFLRTDRVIYCPVKLCPGRMTSCTNRQVEDTILVINKVTGPHPMYNQYDLFIAQRVITVGHLGTARCKRRAEKRRHRLSPTVARVATGTEFQERDQVIENLDTFKYLGEILSFDNSNWPAVSCNPP